MAWGRHIVAAAAALLLTGCLWGPGRFTSELALRSDGSFVLDYKGQILLQVPEDKPTPATPWDRSMARCFADGRAELAPGVEAAPVNSADEPAAAGDKTRPCTDAEIARLKAEHDKAAAERIAAKSAENAQMAKMFGLPGSDDESNRAFAARLMKYQGWRSVVYRGGGVFEVDYHFAGRADQDFAFPMMPGSDLIMPFVAIRRRADRTVQVSAPAFTGGAGPFGARALAMGMPKPDNGPPSRAQGRFTIVTNGEILTNNSEDGPVATTVGKRVQWDVGPASTKVPELLVRL